MVLGTEIEVNELQPSNNPYPKLVMSADIVALARFEQFWKIELPSEVTVFGMVIEVRPLLLKQLELIVFIWLGIVIDVRLVHP